MVESMSQMDRLLRSFVGVDDPVAVIETAYEEAVRKFVGKLETFNPFEMIEVARIASLPFAPVGQVAVTADAGAAKVELLAAMALAARSGVAANTSDTPSLQPQALSLFMSEASSEIDDLVRLAHLRDIAKTDVSDQMALIALLVRGNGVWMRNTSYPEMVEVTIRQLFCDNPDVRNALVAGMGFDAADALAVLTAVDSLQADAMNHRFGAMFDAISDAMSSTLDGQLEPDVRATTQELFQQAWEPDADVVTVSVSETTAATGIAEGRVRAVVDRFRLDLTDLTPLDVVDAFTAGANPWRVQPLAASNSGRVMLPHNALTVDAVRESLETYLKGQPSWNTYAKHRGQLLETRVSKVLGKVLPGAAFRDGFEYYIPNNEMELAIGDPAKYTKRVEGDHLITLDDVAIVVEDKAVALSALSRGGKVTRMRTDLTGILTKAAEQSGRLRDAIMRDGGVQTEDEGWIDLRHIREIHTIVVSLDDLSSVTTATTELVRAGLLDIGNIPWTVSLHDLELIVELVDRPAEFLLYLQRRRNPEVTRMFAASDELDLFLYFFEAGLWVEPDPDQVRVAFPFMPAPTTAERRRYRNQRRGYVTSRTDQLDRWFYGRNQRTGVDPAEYEGPSVDVPKPQMVPSPLADIVDALESRRVPGWLSIGAMLLGHSTTFQQKTISDIKSLLDNPSSDRRGRSLTQPLTGTTHPEEGWLLVWATLPAEVDRASEEKRLRDYLRAKKGQLLLPRGALFLFAESNRELVEVLYDDHTGPLSPELEARVQFLRPPEALVGRPHPAGRKAPQVRKPR